MFKHIEFAPTLLSKANTAVQIFVLLLLLLELCEFPSGEPDCRVHRADRTGSGWLPCSRSRRAPITSSRGVGARCPSDAPYGPRGGEPS